MTTEKYYASMVQICLEFGEKRTSSIQQNPRVLDLYGLSGLRTRHFLNSLMSNGKLVLLELGVYKGASIASAMYNNPEAKAYAVDNWCYSPIDIPPIKYEVDKDGKPTKNTIPWPNVKWSAEDNIKKYTSGTVTLIEKNWSSLTKTDIKEPVNIVHLHALPGVNEFDFLSTLNALYNLIEVTSVLVVENYISPVVKDTLNKWFATRKVKVDYQEIKDSDSLSNTDHWGGGIGVFVVTKQDITNGNK